jgi:putative ubiquitin-RnfH superfamily antitoxin RatB of RatAB toxin-antitoxin module
VSRQSIDVEVVLATPERQSLIELTLPAGATVADAIDGSGIVGHFPGLAAENLATGIWGRETSATTILRDGDRVELYRPLAMDPREARRRLAESGRTMLDERD